MVGIKIHVTNARRRIKQGTRPSALGMSDPIWGPLIHIFVDEKKIVKDKDLDQVNCEYTALRFLNF